MPQKCNTTKYRRRRKKERENRESRQQREMIARAYKRKTPQELAREVRMPGWAGVPRPYPVPSDTTKKELVMKLIQCLKSAQQKLEDGMVPSAPEEICLLCKSPITDQDRQDNLETLLVNEKKVYVHRTCPSKE